MLKTLYVQRSLLVRAERGGAQSELYYLNDDFRVKRESTKRHMVEPQPGRQNAFFFLR
jgi:hypothetical protein